MGSSPIINGVLPWMLSIVIKTRLAWPSRLIQSRLNVLSSLIKVKDQKYIRFSLTRSDLVKPNDLDQVG